MADRYWVGGSGTWNNTSTTNWSATSGGASGASAPTTADNVFFNANSNTGTGAFTVTVGTSAACLSLDATGLDGTMTLAVNANMTVAGSWTNPATNFVFSGGSTITFSSTSTGRTITTNNISTVAAITFDGVGGGWTLGSAFTTTGVLTVTNGTFSTGNFALTALRLSSSNANTRTITLGSSTVSLTGGIGVVNLSTTTNLTFNANTSTINITDTGNNVTVGSGVTLYDLSLTYAAGNTNLSTSFLSSVNCRNFSISGQAASTTASRNVLFDPGVTLTCSGSFTINAGADRQSRVTLGPSTRTGAVSNISAASYSVADCNLDSIAFTGAGAPVTGTSVGDYGNCTGVTFTAAKTVYVVGGTGTWTASNRWATSSGGAGSIANYPLGQDTVVIDDNSGAAASNLSLLGGSSLLVGFSSLNCSQRTTAFTITGSTQQIFIGGAAGGFNLNANITISGIIVPIFQGTGTMTWACPTSYNVGMRPQINARAAGAKLQLQNNWTSTSAQEWTLTAGTIDLNGNALTFAGQYLINSTLTKNLTYGTGGTFTITPNSGYTSGIVNCSNCTGYTYTGSGLITYSGTGAFAVTSFMNNNTGVTETNAHSITISANFGANTFGQGTANVKDWNLSGLTCGAFTYSAASTLTFYGDVTLGANIASYVASTATFTCASTNATARTITNTGPTLPYNFTMNGLGGTFRLTANLTFSDSARTSTLTAGTIDLNGFTLNTGRFSTTGSAVRSLNFSTTNSKIVIPTNNATIFTVAAYDNLSVTGTSRFEFSYSGATGTRTLSLPSTTSGATTGNKLNVFVTAGTDIISTTSILNGSLDFTGFSGTFADTVRTIVGSLTISTGMTLPSPVANRTELVALTGETTTLTTNGKSIPFPIRFGIASTSGISGTVSLGDALTITNTGTALDFRQCSFNSNNFSVTCSGTLTFATTDTRTISFGNSTWTFSASSAALFDAGTNAINTTVTFSPGAQIVFSNASTKTFIPGDYATATWPTVVNAGAGALTTSGSGYVNSYKNNVSPTSFLFASSANIRISTLDLLGSAGNLVTIGPTAATNHTLTKTSPGIISCDYMSISRSQATGTGAAFYAGANSTNGGNNTGWIFGAAPSQNQQFFSFFNWA